MGCGERNLAIRLRTSWDLRQSESSFGTYALLCDAFIVALRMSFLGAVVVSKVVFFFPLRLSLSYTVSFLTAKGFPLGVDAEALSWILMLAFFFGSDGEEKTFEST